MEEKYSFRGSSYPTGKIVWANIRVRLDGQNIQRHGKAIFLREFLDAHRFKLRVCLECCLLYSRPLQSPHSDHQLNCNQCEKCLRTIPELALAGIDPNDCGFVVDQSTFNLIRVKLFSPHSTKREDMVSWWKPLQRAVLDGTELDLYGAREFFDWLKRVNLDSIVRPDESFLSNLYHRLPYPIAKLLRTIWEKTPVWRLRFYADLALASATKAIAISCFDEIQG